MKLESALKGVSVIEVMGDAHAELVHITSRTQCVKAGSCFVALPGSRVDGHSFIDEAIKKGARIVVTSRRVDVPRDVTNVVVSHTHDAFARLSAQLYGEPSKHMHVVGVTGTNGKTTTTYLLESIWRAQNVSSGVIGTIGYRYGERASELAHTTPMADELQAIMSEMNQHHVSHLAMEVSSHALDQGRAIAVHFDGAIFTNLTQDHLDYHPTMDDYYAAKRRLFTDHLVVSEKPVVWAVVNVDDPYGKRLAGELSVPTMRVSLKDRSAEVVATRFDATIRGISMDLQTPVGALSVRSPLCGAFNGSNILGAVAAAICMKIDPQVIVRGIANLSHVPGRLEAVPNRAGRAVFVDYAHTPDALRNILSTLKPLTKGRLWVVFGCGGDRDKGKRPLMGFEAASGADVVVVTSDNPRTESPEAIVADILPGTEQARERFVQPDRREAIRLAITHMAPDDVVVLAGKGHEDYQIIGTVKIPFDDAAVAAEVLETL